MAMAEEQPRPPEHSHWAPSHPASVVVEIGPGRGALVLYCSEGLLGSEVEVSPSADPATRTHSAVRERHLPGGTVYAAVFGSLSAGLYRLTGSDQVVSVIDGEVSEAAITPFGGGGIIQARRVAATAAPAPLAARA